MLAWKVDYGYISREKSLDKVTKISDFNFLDFDRPFGFITTNTEVGISISLGKENIFDKWKENGIKTIIEQLGEDYYRTYGEPLYIDPSFIRRYQYFNELLPSYFLAAPNMLNLVQNDNNSYRPVIYFKGFNRILAYGPSSSGGIHRWWIFAVDGDSLTLIFSATNSSFFNSTNTPELVGFRADLGSIWCINNYDKNKKLTEQEAFIRQLDIYNSSNQDTMFFDAGNAVIISSDIILGKLFDGNPVPDFSFTPDNPYEPGGDSGEGGGGGNFDDNSDPIPDSSLPTISSANTGFTRIYNPTLSQVQALARYLWTDETVIQTIWNHIKQYFENPMEAIIGFNLVPVPVPDGGTQNFALMYIDTGVSMTVAANQFVDVDCGILEITPYYGSALDYSPYTKISCFLPFIGTVQLNVDEVMNTTLQVKYRVDICSGSCVAKILVNGNVLYQYSGHCAINIPISAADFSSYVTASISVAKLAIGAAVGGGMGALMAGGDNPVQQTNQVVTTTQVTNTARNPNTGRQITTGTQTTVQTVERPNDQSSTQGSYAGLVPENITNTVGQIMSSKPHVEHSGSFSGNTGYLGVRRPYVIIQRPNMCMPSQYQAFNGFPSMITLSLGECKGFTKVQQVQLTGFYATNPEQAEILQLLKSGVIL